jgi:regulator of protease activity HflC (stomatin/prohibitin superfamily)
MLRFHKVGPYERGLLFKDRAFAAVLQPGRYVRFDPLRRLKLDVVSVREPWLKHQDLDVIARQGALADEARVLDLADAERALVWVDGRFEAVIGPGLYALWTAFRKVRVETVAVDPVRFEHPELERILESPTGAAQLEVASVEPGQTALLFVGGRLQGELGPGRHAFWKGVAKTVVQVVDLREAMVDVAGQEIMTADKVTLRLNAVATYRVADAKKAVTEVVDYRQALYREAQLALRAVIGTRELDALLADKDAVAKELEESVRAKARAFGVEVTQLGIRDVILPGEMKDLFNKVTEAKKAAEAAVITRREETAAMRSQANTAKLLADNPTLMRLRELEALEKVSQKANLTVVLGEQGLTDRVVKLV